MHENFVRETMRTFTPAYFAKFGGGGDPSDAPIFIVGMPRSGSTLLEQILSSHPDVQGLGETLALSRTFRAAVNELKADPGRFNASTFYRDIGTAYLAALRNWAGTGGAASSTRCWATISMSGSFAWRCPTP